MKLPVIFLLGVVVALTYATDDPTLEENAGRFLAAYSTRTILTLTTKTSTVSYTCANYFGSKNCQKRRFRRASRITFDDQDADEGVQLDSALSENENPNSDYDLPSETNRKGLALTVWSTTSSTYTITYSSTNKSTTFSLSFYCTIVSVDFPPACSG